MGLAYVCCQPVLVPMRYRLRTLLIVVAAGPLLVAIVYWAIEEYRWRRMMADLIELIQ